MKIIHIDDSRLAIKCTQLFLQSVFDDACINSYLTSEFIELIKNNETFEDVDIIITDLLMPDLPGQDIIKYVKGVNDKTFITVLSSNIQHGEKMLAFDNGCNYFLEKPATLEKIQKLREVFYAKR